MDLMQPAEMLKKTFSVTELTSAIKGILEPNFRGISVRGEVSNFKHQSSGHLYFVLKDAEAQISAAMFRGNAASLARLPKDGDQIVATGELSIYAPRGNYQIIIRELQFLGLGELLLKLHQLKETLEKRGWFEKARKKPLPKLPRRIGVVTSPTGAAFQDILNVLSRRFSGLQIILNPVKVQGDGSAQEIAKAIEEMNRFELADVLIVGRGGGSIEDLWAFNEEIVAKAIFESKIPVISAVGHETDFTIADYVADIRAPTPSAAAELVVEEKLNLLGHLSRFSQQLRQLLSHQIETRRKQLAALGRHPLLCQPHSLLALPIRRLDDLERDFENAISQELASKRLHLSGLARSLETLRPAKQIASLKEQILIWQRRIDQAAFQALHLKKTLLPASEFYEKLDRALLRSFALKKDLLQRLKGSISSIHPQHLLNKGYSILFSEKGDSIILSLKQIQPNQTFTAVLSDGKIRAMAVQTEEKPNGSIL